MRGKATSIKYKKYGNRITPAYAGKRFLDGFPLGQREDHPRLCGEKIRRLLRSNNRLGSPPPMRGKAKFWQRVVLVFWDHPRLCGEK